MITEIHNTAPQDVKQLRNAWKAIHNCGYNVLPCRWKKPVLKEWKKYQSERITKETLGGWLHSNEYVNNFAYLTGAKPYNSTPAVVVVDPDSPECWEIVKTKLPQTPLYTLTKKGRHLVYRRPDTKDVIHGGKIRLAGQKLAGDVKADGGYCMAPGSVHPDADHFLYRSSLPWTRELIDSLPLFDPLWFDVTEYEPHEFETLDAEVAAEDRVVQARDWLKGKAGATANGSAGAYCLHIARTLVVGFALDEAQAQALLYEWGQRPDQQNASGDYYPWSRSETDHKVRQAIASVERYPGKHGDRLAVDYEKKVAEIVMPYEPEEEDGATEQAATEDETKPARRSRVGYFYPELVAMPDPVWLVREHFHTNTLALIVGEPGVCKSFLAIDLACRVATGIDYHGRKVAKGKVAYVASEGAAGIKHRLRAWQKEFGAEIGYEFIVYPQRWNLCDEEQAKSLSDLILKDLGEVSLVVIDTLARNMIGSENDPKDMATFVASIDSIRQATGATILVIHHLGKDKQKGARGHSSLIGAQDTILSVIKGDDDSRVYINCEKQKEAAEFASYSLTKKTHNFGTDAEGDPITSLVLLPSDAAPKQADEDTELLDFIFAFPTSAAEAWAMGDIVANTGVSRASAQRLIEKAERAGVSPRLEKIGDGTRNDPYRYIRV